MSLAAGRINSSPIVKDFVALAMQLATKNDALSADTFDEVVAFNDCFCSSCSRFFLLKNSKGLSFFFFINLFIYLFLAALGLRCCARAFSSCSERRLLFILVCGLLLLQSRGSRHAGSVVVARGL